MAGKSKEMELAIKIAGKIDKSFNSALSAVNKGIQGATKTMAIGAAAAAAAVGAITMKAVDIGKEFEASMSQVSATLQIDKATQEGAAQYAILEEAARQCGRETAFSATEAAEGLNNLAMAGYDATEAATALPTVLALAGAGGIEMADSARYITASLASLGLDRTEENFGHLADVMAITAAKAKTDVSQIGEAITTLGGTGQGLKGGINEISAALGVLANADITGSEGGTHLRNLILSLQNPRNKNAAAMFQSLGVEAYDAQGQMRGLNEIFGDLSTAMAGMTDEERNAALSTIFKQTDLAAARALLQGCGEEYDNLYQEALNASDGIGAAQEMYNRQLDNLQGDIDIFKSALSDVGISFYETLQPALRGAVQFATSIVSAFGEGFKDGGIVGGLSNVLDIVKEKIDGLPESIRQVAAAFAALGAANLVGGILSSNTWQNGVKGATNFGKTLTQVPRALMGVGKQAAKTIAGVVPPGLARRVTGMFSQISGSVTGLASTVASRASGMWNSFTNDSLLGRITGRVTSFVGTLSGTLGRIGGVLTSVGGQMISGLGTMMSIGMKMLMPAALIGGLLVVFGLIQSRFGEQINSILAMVRERGPQIIQNLVSGITSRIPELISQGATLITNLMNTIGALAPSIMTGGAQIIVSLVQGVAQNAPMLISGAVNMIGGFLTGILQALPMLLTAGMQLLLGLVQGIVANLPVMIQGAIQAIQGFIQGFMQNLPTILSLAAQIILTLVSGLASALPTLIQGAIGIISTLGQGILQNLPMIIQTGAQVIGGIAAGLISGIGTLLSAVPQILGELINALMSVDWGALGGDIISGIGSGIVSGAKGIFSGIKNAVTGGGGDEGQKTPSTPSAPTTVSAPSFPSPSVYMSAGLQGAAAYAQGVQNGSGQIGAAMQSSVEAGTSGAGIGAWQQAGLDGASSFTGGIDMGLASYTFDPSSVGLDVSGLQADMQTAATSGGDAFTSGLDSSLAGYSFDTSSIGVDTGALTTLMSTAGTEGGTAFVDALTQSLGSGFDLASAANIDTSSITSTMTTAGSSGGSAFTSSLSSSMGAFSFSPASLGINAGVMQGAMRPAGLAGGQALTQSLSSAINAGASSVISAANRVGNGVNEAIRSGFSKAKSSASSAMSSIKSTCSSGARSAASSVKNAFENMSIRIPKPKIPVVSVSSSSTTVGGQSVSVPKFSVSYHALGGIFDQATLLQSINGGNHVVGERGPEAILPLDLLWERMEQILQGILQGDNSIVTSLLNRLEGMGRSVSTPPEPIGAGSGGGTIYFSPTYNLYGTATREDAERAGKATFEEFKRFMKRYEKDKNRTRF